LIQRPQLEESSEDFEEEEVDDTYINMKESLKAPIKSLPMIEKKKKERSCYDDSDEEEDEEMSPDEQNESFRIEIPDECDLLNDDKFNLRGRGYTCTMMNYWARKAIKYPTEKDTFLSEDTVKMLQKVEPNKERNDEISQIFNRVWNDVISQGLKYLNEEDMEDVIASYTFHTTLSNLTKGRYEEEPRKYEKTDKAGKEAVRSWLKWTYRHIDTEEFFESLIELEDAMEEEKLIETKVHEILEAVMIIQETNEKPEEQKERMYQELEEIK
jgi:hypothetical protein